MHPPYARELVTIVDVAAESLLGMSDDDASRRPAPGKWSSKEIIGHLIDSAANNHQRFVRARWSDDLVFLGYAQEDWVAAQEYQAAPWEELVGLWHAYNLHLARVMAATPEAIRTRRHSRHNLHEIGWRSHAADQPGTLDFLMEDYVRHLQHHLGQISAIARAFSVA
jgi:hypothetical protein